MDVVLCGSLLIRDGRVAADLIWLGIHVREICLAMAVWPISIRDMKRVDQVAPACSRHTKTTHERRPIETNDCVREPDDVTSRWERMCMVDMYLCIVRRCIDTVVNEEGEG